MANQPAFTGSNMVAQLGLDQTATKDSGAGFIPDLLRACTANGVTFTLTDTEVKDSGAGFVQDCLRMVAAGY